MNGDVVEVGSVWNDTRTDMLLVIVSRSTEPAMEPLWDWVALSENANDMMSPWYERVFHDVCERIA